MTNNYDQGQHFVHRDVNSETTAVHDSKMCFSLSFWILAHLLTVRAPSFLSVYLLTVVLEMIEDSTFLKLCTVVLYRFSPTCLRFLVRLI